MMPDALRSPPGGKPWLLYALLGASLLGNMVLGARVIGGSAPDGVSATLEPSIPIVGEASALSNAPVPPDQVPPLPEPASVAQKAGTLRFSGSVSSSLSATFLAAEGTSPAALSAVFSRLFVWDVDFRRDLHKGDRVDVLYQQGSGVEPKILAARLVLSPDSEAPRTFAAFRFQAPGDRYASYWAMDGQEVERRLIEGPLTDYEQIATLLKERPSHEGMDFKTPIGTPLRLPRAGKVTRVNFDAEANGQGVEVRYTDGTLARFTHLNEIKVAPGQTLSAGTEIGTTGNTGRSVAAHLHYELVSGGKIVDPVNYHGVLRRKIQPDALPRFQQEAEALLSQLDGQVASR